MEKKIKVISKTLRSQIFALARENHYFPPKAFNVSKVIIDRSVEVTIALKDYALRLKAFNQLDENEILNLVKLAFLIGIDDKYHLLHGEKRQPFRQISDADLAMKEISMPSTQEMVAIEYRKLPLPVLIFHNSFDWITQNEKALTAAGLTFIDCLFWVFNYTYLVGVARAKRASGALNRMAADNVIIEG